MAKKEVTVVINGEEYVSKAAQEAEAGLTGFAGAVQQLKDKLIPVIDVTKLVELAVRALTAAYQAAKQFVFDSVAAYDAYTTAQVKLNAQSKLTGMSMKDMNALVKTARDSFGLGTVAAVDITAAVAKFASQAGQSARAAELMAAALELGAASGQNAAQVAEGLSSALAGNDEWLNKLGLANPSGLYDEFAKSLGTTGSKLDDTQKKLAIMTAIMDAGNKVTGVYAERMASGAGAQERLNNNLDTAKTMFGAAIEPIRVFVIEGLTALLNVIGPLVIAFGYLASGLLNLVIAPFKLAQSAIGSVIEVVGRLTGNKTLEEWGKKNAQAFVQYTDSVAKWAGVAKPANDATTEMGKAHELAAVKITASKDAIEKHTEANKKAEASHKPLKLAISITQEAMDRLAQSAKNQLPPQNAQDFNAALDKIRQNADALIAKLPPITQGTGDAAKNTKDMAREAESVARGAIDAAGAFGVIDEKAQQSLNSAVSIASAVGDMAKNGFSFAGAVGIIGSVASIVGSMMNGDAARRKLIADNNTELARLRKELGNLSLNVTGDTFNKIQGALTEVMPQLKGGRGAKNTTDVVNALAKRGIGMGDLKKLADQLGIRIYSDSGALSVDGLRQLLEAMGLVELGQFGDDYDSQLESVTAGFDVNKTDATGQIAELGKLGGKFSPALEGVIDPKDLAGSRKRLAALFKKIQDGGLTAADLGGMTGTQFLDFVTTMIGKIDSVLGAGAPAPAAETSAPSEPTGDVVSGDTGGGAVSMPVETVQAVIKAMNADVSNILTSHTVLHERIAAATEESALRLGNIDTNVAFLVKLAGGGMTESVNRRLEDERYALAVQQGQGAAF